MYKIYIKFEGRGGSVIGTSRGEQVPQGGEGLTSEARCPPTHPPPQNETLFGDNPQAHCRRNDSIVARWFSNTA